MNSNSHLTGFMSDSRRGNMAVSRGSRVSRNSKLDSVSRSEAVNLLDQITSPTSRIEDHIENNSLLTLFSVSKQFQPDDIFTILKRLNDFTDFNYETQIISRLYIQIFNSNFIDDVLKDIITKFLFNTPTLVELDTMLLFLNNCLKQSPISFMEQMTLLYPTVLMCCDSFQQPKIQTMKSEFVSNFNSAKDLLGKPNPKSRRLPVGSSVQITANSDYRCISIIPGPDDLFCLNDEVVLKPNKVSTDSNSTDNKYGSIDDYLDTQFRLLKEDFIRPLRDSVAKIRQNAFNRAKLTARDIDVRIYDKVIIEDLLPTRNGIVYKIKFDISKFSSKMDWKKARRFIYGSLLCFTNNFFDSLHFGFVVESDAKDLCKGNLMVQFENDPIEEILTNNEFMMLETKNLFEAYRHVLSKLQKFNSQSLPFGNYFAFAENKIKIPEYMTAEDARNVNLWSIKEVEQDASQLSAFRNSLTSNISLIQGPPGTGKTYVGLKIIKYLAKNFQSLTRNIGPILVVCYTNHALDQFLEDIISELGVDNVLRVGGRSKLECMKDCNINTIKGKWIRKKKFPRYLGNGLINNKRQLEHIENQMVQSYIAIMNLSRKLLSFNDLNSFMSYSHRRHFQHFQFDQWLMGADIELDTYFMGFSEIKESLLNAVFGEIKDEYISLILYGLYEELLMEPEFQEDEPDVEVEDPEAFLFEQRFLDEDVGFMKYSNKYRGLYNTEITEEKFLQHGDSPYEFKTVANSKLIKQKLKKTEPVTEETYQNIADMNVDFNLRLQLYKYWFNKFRSQLIHEYNILKVSYDELNKVRQELNNKEYELIMKETKVIGMTTTGAARYGPILDQVGCKVVVIEEAAEVLEAHVICSLSEHCQHLIMIGDHKQLRPKVDVYDLEINYNLAISLFERLIYNKCPFFTLEYQHRMKPDISKCVKPIYPDLKDSESVFQYLSVPGMNTDLYFFNHQIFENETNETSYQNNFEANFVTEFCRYLLKCGNLPSKITVLTFYTGQLYNISGRMKASVFKGIRICVLDNYQGEENDIIILSLVRSNKNGDIGFVKCPNRLCVALSRAKRGFYVIGNLNMLQKKIPFLQNVLTNHIKPEHIGTKLPLQCSMHPHDDNYFAEKIEDFSKSCPSTCEMMLKCSHKCRSPCHTDQPSHKKYRCIYPCLKTCKRNQHPCKALCWQVCKCNETIEHDLKCGHKATEFCHVPNSSIVCKKLLSFVLKCGHLKRAVCGTDTKDLICNGKCNKSLPCGHYCSETCSNDCRCLKMVEFILPCSHQLVMICGTDISGVKCREIVFRQFNCGHKISTECWNNSNKCFFKIQTVLRCGHEKYVKCSEQFESIKCEKSCHSKLVCSHLCQSQCTKCMNGRFHSKCRIKCLKEINCGHNCQSVCHSGVCPPCTVRCTHANCPNLCGEECNQECVTCLKLFNITNNIFTMSPCKCEINKDDYQPTTAILENDLMLKCQICQKVLSTPYKGLSLKAYNKCHSQLFRLLPPDEIQKWKELFDKIKTSNIIDCDILDEMLEKIRNHKIFNSNDSIFRVSRKCCKELLEISSKINKRSDNIRLEEFNENVRKSLVFLIQWIDPTARRFDARETTMFNNEKSILNLMLDIIHFIHSATAAEYALIFRKSFSLLEEWTKSFGEINLGDFQKKFVEIQKDIGKNTDSSKKEELLVIRIIEAKDVLVEFQLTAFSNEEKLKRVKNLIRQCHPDKNKSVKSGRAFQRLFELKQKLEREE